MADISLGPWVREPRRLHFPVEAEVPESTEHFELRTALYFILKAAFAHRAILGSDQFVYWDPTDPAACLAPDVLVRLGTPHRPFDSWKVWEQGAPDVAVEIASRSDASEAQWSVKLERYRRLGVRELVRFDPDAPGRPLRIWDHVDGDLVERRAGDPRFAASGPLQLFWVVRVKDDRPTLRLAEDAEGTRLLPTPEETALLARQVASEAQRQTREAMERATEAVEAAERAEARVRELEAELSRRR